MGKLNSNLLKKGDKLSRTSYLTIIHSQETSPIKRFEVQNESGEKWVIDAAILENECYSASQFDEGNIQKVSRTELIEIFNNVGDTVFTVNFDKLPTADDFLVLSRGEGGKILSFADMTKAFKKFKGENRTLVGYIVSKENGFGRSTVVDLQIPKGEHNIRQVDHRTLNWLIVKNVKYVVK